MTCANGDDHMKKVLVIDDSSMIRKVTRMILERLHFEVWEAESALQALNMVRRNKPDAIMVDWDMPNMNGVDFIQTYQAQVIGQKPVIIYCVTEYIDSNVNRALQLGADSYLMKPFDLNDVQQKFAECGLLN